MYYWMCYKENAFKGIIPLCHSVPPYKVYVPALFFNVLLKKVLFPLRN